MVSLWATISTSRSSELLDEMQQSAGQPLLWFVRKSLPRHDTSKNNASLPGFLVDARSHHASMAGAGIAAHGTA